MTVVEKGESSGMLQIVEEERDLDTDTPIIQFKSESGMIASDLSLGAATTMSKQLLQNVDLSHQGVTPLGEGFRLNRSEVEFYGYNPNELPNVIKRYLIVRDLVRS